jgi:hypothetical protein
MIYTAFRIRIQDVIDGTAGSTLELTAEGGSVGETTLVVSNFPTLAIGETYLLLVGDLPGRRCVLGGARGAFLMPPPGVSCEAITPRAVATVRTIRKAAGR